MSEEREHRLEAAERVLQKYWGYPAFRPGQVDVVQAVLDGGDVMAILPTGGGKSICYQVPALLNDGLTLVISPLIALMQDQVDGLAARGIPAAALNSTLSQREIEQRLTDAEFGRYRLLYVAPERLQTELFTARVSRLNVSMLAVDEAHCISEWGHHFRPDYLRIPEARALLGEPLTIAVTATATPRVRRDIVEYLHLRSPRVIVRGFDRPNIRWSIFKPENQHAKVMEVIDGVPGTGIVYASTRRNVERWAAWLNGRGVAAAHYHGGMATADRQQQQSLWLADERRVMVATNAFGMGIDKPDVRFVIHVDLPGSLEGYYQEAGRGGRDGRPAYAVLLYRRDDESTQRALIEQGHPTAGEVQAVYDAVCNRAQVAMGDRPEEPLVVDYDVVGRMTGYVRGKIRASIDLLARQERLQVVPARRFVGLIRFLHPASEIRRYVDRLDNQALATFCDALLRTVHADAFTSWWEIDLRTLMRRTRLPRGRLLKGMAYLKERGLIDWRPPGGALQVVLLEARSKRVPVDDLLVRRDRRRAEARFDDMLRYARSVTCRRHFLLAYFGEESPQRCGRCDVCLGRHRPVVVTPEDEPTLRRILVAVADGRFSDAWMTSEAETNHHLDGLVDWLVQEAYLTVSDPLELDFDVTEKARVLLDQWSPGSDP